MSVLRQDNVFIIKFSLSPRKFFGAKLTETAKIIIIIIIVRHEIMSILGLDSGYTVKYSPSPSGVPSGEGLNLTVYPSSRPNTDTVYPSSRHNTNKSRLHYLRNAPCRVCISCRVHLWPLKTALMLHKLHTVKYHCTL